MMNRLKLLREEKQLLQKDIAEFLGVTQKAVSLYENEKRDMSTDILYKLANYFNCSIDYLLGKSDVRNPEEIKNIPFANSGGLDTEGLEDEDLLELQKQVDYIKKLKGKK